MSIGDHIKRAVVLSVATTLIVSQSAGSVSFMHVQNNIYAYDATAQECLQSSSFATTIEGNENVESLLRFLTGKGLTLAQASGFAGNIHQETGGTFNPAIIQGMKVADENYTPVNGTGFGLVQWTFTARQQPLVDLAKQTNRNNIDLSLQFDYIWQEVNGAWKSTLLSLTADPSIDPIAAAIIVHGKTSKTKNDPRFVNAPSLAYEGSNDTASEVVEKRGQKALEYYNKYRDIISDGQGVGGTSTVASLSTDPCANVAATAGCQTTAPLYGAGGNGNQLSREQLIQIYGTPDVVKNNLVDVDFLGKNVRVHKLVAGCLNAVANDIKISGSTYTVKTIGGYRIDGDGFGQIGEKSYHNYGAAVDINAAENPFSEVPTGYTMPTEYIRAFKGRGFSWGGDWRTDFDYMHFEYNGIGPSGVAT